MPLGWVADNLPEIKRKVREKGLSGNYEIGCLGGKLQSIKGTATADGHFMLMQGDKFVYQAEYFL